MDSRVRLLARRGSVSQAFTLSLAVAREKAEELRAEGWEDELGEPVDEDVDGPRLGEPIPPAAEVAVIPDRPNGSALAAPPAEAVG